MRQRRRGRPRHARSLLPPGRHLCGAGCGDPNVPRHLFACKHCWSVLPDRHRVALERQTVTGKPPHGRPLADARTWWADHRQAPQ